MAGPSHGTGSSEQHNQNYMYAVQGTQRSLIEQPINPIVQVRRVTQSRDIGERTAQPICAGQPGPSTRGRQENS